MSSSCPRRVGLDIGGTAIKVGALSGDGEILFRDSSALGEDRSAKAYLETMVALARRAGVRDQLGVGIAGLVDRKLGRVDVSPNLEALVGFDLRSELARELKLEEANVRIENDANVAALGEARLGAAKGEDNAMVVTLGTGIGGGLILNGELFGGEAGLTGELGHVVIDPDGLLCGCGTRGCAETLASASAAERRAREAGLPAAKPGDLPLLCAAARAGDKPATELLFSIGRDLGFAFATVVTLLDVRCFVVGGGFGAALDLLDAGVRAGLEERTFGERTQSVKLLPATLGEDAGWIGASLLSE